MNKAPLVGSTHEERGYLVDGDCIRLKSFTHQFIPQGYDAKGKPLGMISTSYSAPKNQVFVAVILGVEVKNLKTPEDQLDIEKVLDKMGWMRKP